MTEEIQETLRKKTEEIQETLKEMTGTEEKSDLQKQLQDSPIWIQLSGKLTVGSLAGYLIGNFTKQITDEAIWYVGLSACLIGGLHYMKWVTINYK